MKKQILQTLLTVGALSLAIHSNAALFTYSDADYFGTIHTTGGVNPPNGSPNGTLLTAGGGSASVTTTFNFVTGDGTASFVIGTPYLPTNVRGTYSSQLGFQVGAHSVQDGFVTLFLRDSAGTEAVAYTSELGSQSITHGSFETQLVISEGITATVAGIIDANGYISYTVSASSGSFILDAAYMEITAIPDGGLTVALLGFGLVGVEGLRRKLRK